MTTPTPQTSAGYDRARIAYCQSRISFELEARDHEHYHRDDCSSLPLFNNTTFPCDCDGPDRLRAQMQGDLAVLTILRLSLDILIELPAGSASAGLLQQICARFVERDDFPAAP